MFSLIVFVIILGVLIIVHECGHFLVAKRMQVKVERFSLGFGPVILSRKDKYTEYSLSLIPLGGYVKIAGDNLQEYKGSPQEYLSQPPGKRAKIVFAGPLLNYILGFLCFWLVFCLGYPALTTKVGSVMEGFGAQEAGLQIGDRITAIDGKNVYLWEDMQAIIQSKKAVEKVRLSILRQDKELSIDVRIKEKQLDDVLGQKRKVGLLGITPYDEVTNIKYNPGQSFIMALKKTGDLTFITYKALWRMVSGKLSVRESVTGPLGIFFITSKAASLGKIAVLQLIGVLSVSLAIFNLLPLPVLDGGHIVLLGLEKIRGKALSVKIERVITQIGFTFLITVAILVTYNDLLRFFGDKLARMWK